MKSICKYISRRLDRLGTYTNPVGVAWREENQDYIAQAS